MIAQLEQHTTSELYSELLGEGLLKQSPNSKDFEKFNNSSSQTQGDSLLPRQLKTEWGKLTIKQ